MRTAALRLCLSGFIVSSIPSLTLASLEYSVKTDEVRLFRTEALEPPPLATLEKGDGVKMIHQGKSSSLIETAGGLKGWMRNEDLKAERTAAAQTHKLGDQQVTGGPEFNFTGCIFLPSQGSFEILTPDRNFAGEIVEVMDKEQVEMRHDEN